MEPFGRRVRLYDQTGLVEGATAMAVDSAFGGYIEDAKTGALKVRMEPQAFLDIDAACQNLIIDLSSVQNDARALGERSNWGLGENNPRLTSASELVKLFREKAFGGPNNAYDTIGDYIAVATEIQTLFKSICDAYERTDEDFARRIRQIRV
ncbi:hypothetical protein [Nocardia pseudovaccinii]|uniref:hypothetical protein n=1 Tax=Nocardia pseudovaccinii TaxID=189540 RepID=UPI0012F48497|nr:hypothetical protein [Nocardia pseudovaccinii]